MDWREAEKETSDERNYNNSRVGQETEYESLRSQRKKEPAQCPRLKLRKQHSS